MIDLRNHYGFTRLPFGKDLALSMLHQHAGLRGRRPDRLVHQY
jgi:hypothetical protein